MAEPFIGEIRMFGGYFAPQGWAFCDGSLLSIAENDALFTLIGTTYGGDGQSTFALPDLRGRILIHNGQGPGLSPRTLGEAGGTEAVTLTTAELPAHTHLLAAVNGVGTTPSPGGAVWAGIANGAHYASGAPTGATMNANSIGAAGSGQPHDNLMPYQCISFIIALSGIYPSQN